MSKTSITIALLVLTAVLAYHNSFNGQFVLDDQSCIVDNTTIHQLWPLTGPLNPPRGGLTVSGRPALNLTLAINYAISGTSPWSYHALNLLIHLLAGLAVFGIVRRSLERIAHPAALMIAGVAAALWIAHPLQTEAVTYIVQRAESLMGLFYLFTLYAVIRGAEAPRPRFWNLAAIIMCALGMATKEVMATAPLVILLYDRTFLAGSFAQAWRQRKGLYLALASTWLVLASLLILNGNRNGSHGFDGVVPWWMHAAMQFPALLRYLWLSVWPNPLIFDYGVIAPTNLYEVLPQGLIVIALLAVTAWGLVRNKPWAFLAVWFFVILAPTSLVPSSRQTFSEHRMYLPLAALCVAVALALYPLSQRKMRTTALLGGLLVAALCMVSIDRNRDYRNYPALYASVVEHYPRNAFGQFVYAAVDMDRGEFAHALARLDIAVEARPQEQGIHYSRAVALLKVNRATEAVAEYEIGMGLGPVTPGITIGHAAALIAAGKVEEGQKRLGDFVATRPDDANALRAVAESLADIGREADAREYLERAQRLGR